jgi:DNA-binding MarR family transcriptional regulator
MPGNASRGEMEAEQKLALIGHVMGTANVFASAVSQLLDRTSAEASGGTLAMQQVKLMLLIARPEQRFKVMDIADFLGVTNAAASRAIDRLVQRGLVDRALSQEDRRAVDLALTADGHALLERFGEIRDAHLSGLLGDYPEDRLRALTTLLDELTPRLLDIDPESDQRCARCGVDVRANCVLRDVMGQHCGSAPAAAGA